MRLRTIIGTLSFGALAVAPTLALASSLKSVRLGLSVALRDITNNIRALSRPSWCQVTLGFPTLRIEQACSDLHAHEHGGANHCSVASVHAAIVSTDLSKQWAWNVPTGGNSRHPNSALRQGA
jgi:hypothetical protein